MKKWYKRGAQGPWHLAAAEEDSSLAAAAERGRSGERSHPQAEDSRAAHLWEQLPRGSLGPAC